MKANLRFLPGVFILSLLTGCSTFPTSGPLSWMMDDEVAYEEVVQEEFDEQGVPLEKIKKSKPVKSLGYAMLDLNPSLVDYFSNQSKLTPEDVDWPKSTKPVSIKVSVGDTVSVTIYESQTGGLFLPTEAGVRAGNFVTLPGQVIDKSGMITIPFAGQIKAAGRSPHQIGQEIVEKLSKRAIEPQAVVTISEQRGSEVSVVGEVESPTRYSLSLGGERILDAIARSGGPSFAGHQMQVTLQRDNSNWTIPFDLLLEDPEKNIYLEPNDTVYLLREAPYYQLFGASGTNGNFNFSKRHVTLAEAIGEARGLDDDRADPAEIYLYRTEPKDTLQNAGVELAAIDGSIVPNELPVIYKLDLRKPNGFFLAQEFPIQNKDIIYIANAESVEFTKFLNLIGLNSSTKINTQTSIQQ